MKIVRLLHSLLKEIQEWPAVIGLTPTASMIRLARAYRPTAASRRGRDSTTGSARRGGVRRRTL